MIEELKSKLRPVEEDDRKNLITVSYSKLSLKDQCDLRYELKYNEGNYSNSGSMATGVGSILHKALELKGRSIMANEQIDYKQLESVVYEGCEEVTDKGSEKIPGINDIIAEYFTDWFAVDPNTDMDMNTKLKLFFDEVLPERMEDKAWNILGTEISFEFVYDNRCIIHGFIDRVDEKTDNPEVLKVVDYKSSKKTFRDTDIKTPLQMVVYDLACVQLFGKIPQFHEYDFILLNQNKLEMTEFAARGI